MFPSATDGDQQNNDVSGIVVCVSVCLSVCLYICLPSSSLTASCIMTFDPRGSPPCSISKISDVVRGKGSCFQGDYHPLPLHPPPPPPSSPPPHSHHTTGTTSERSQLIGFCGNYQIEEEEGEECDAGALGKVGEGQLLH